MQRASGPRWRVGMTRAPPPALFGRCCYPGRRLTAAAFAMHLRADQQDASLSIDQVVTMAQQLDPARHRELLTMIATARELSAAVVAADEK